MKILKYILFILLGLVLLFFAFGLLNPSIEYGHEITVNKSLKEAWAVCHDETKYAQWLDGFKSTELISGEKWQEGAKSKIIVNPGEREEDFAMIETLQEVKEFERVKMNYVNEMMDFDQTMSFKEEGGKAVIKTESSVSAKGIFMKSMFALMETFGGAFQKQEEHNINNLKKVIDENTTDYYAADSTVVLE